jgi:RND family efflux transporter MFP subunit
MANVIPLFSSRLIGIAVIASVLASACSNGTIAQGQGQPPVAVELQSVETTTVRETSEFVGALEAQQRVALRPETQGRIVAIYASPGERVDAGTPILELQQDKTQAQVGGASADVDAARAALTTAGARLRAAEAEATRAAADVELQNSEYERIAQLVQEGAESRQSLDRVTNSQATAQATLQSAQENVSVAQAELAEAQARVERAEADRRLASENLQDTRIVAPIAGVVGDVPVKVGDYVTPETTLTSIIQNGALDLNISVPIERSPDLRVGLPVELLDAEGNSITRGEISFVSPQVNNADQAVLAKASFPNDGRLKDGQFVRARVIWESSPGILVPTEAVTRVAGKTFVFVAVPNAEATSDDQPQQIAQQRPVTLGDIQGNSYHVLSGIEPGDQVITSGVLNLSDGAPIMPGQTEQSVTSQ